MPILNNLVRGESKRDKSVESRACDVTVQKSDDDESPFPNMPLGTAKAKELSSVDAVRTIPQQKLITRINFGSILGVGNSERNSHATLDYRNNFEEIRES